MTGSYETLTQNCGLQAQSSCMPPTRCDPDAVFQRIFVERDVTSGLELLQRLERAESLLLEQPQHFQVRLIVIDSVANIFR